MFGMGWSEMMVIGIVALIVIGPKDLPDVFRTLGQFAGKARQMAKEFSRAMDQAANESGVSSISKTLNSVANPRSFGMEKLREATGVSTPKTSTPKPGGEVEKLTAEREEMRSKIEAATAKAATERLAREAAAAKAKAEAVETAEAAPAATAKATKPKAAKPAPKPAAKSAPKTAAKPRTTKPKTPKTEA